jgi:hypothetical protein
LGWIPPFLAKGKGAFAIRALYVLQFYTERFFFFASIFFFPSGSISPLLFRKNGSTTRAKIKEEEEEERGGKLDFLKIWEIFCSCSQEFCDVCALFPNSFFFSSSFPSRDNKRKTPWKKGEMCVIYL